MFLFGKYTTQRILFLLLAQKAKVNKWSNYVHLVEMEELYYFITFKYSKLIHVMCSEHCLVHSKCSINVNAFVIFCLISVFSPSALVKWLC